MSDIIVTEEFLQGLKEENAKYKKALKKIAKAFKISHNKVSGETAYEYLVDKWKKIEKNLKSEI